MLDIFLFGYLPKHLQKPALIFSFILCFPFYQIVDWLIINEYIEWMFSHSYGADERRLLVFVIYPCLVAISSVLIETFTAQQKLDKWAKQKGKNWEDYFKKNKKQE